MIKYEFLVYLSVFFSWSYSLLYHPTPQPTTRWMYTPNGNFLSTHRPPSPFILIVIGTRPEAIKMAPVYHELIRNGNAPIVCLTGQHPDLLSVFLSELNVKHQVTLLTYDNSKQTLGQLTAHIIEGSTAMLETLKPDIVLVQGDTTSAYGVAYAAFLLQIEIGHVEAGLRTYNLQNPFPEEYNRQAIGTIASLHFAPTLTAVNALKQEGVPSQHIFHTGNTAIDAILHYTTKKYVDQQINVVSDVPSVLHEHQLPELELLHSLIQTVEPLPFGYGRVNAPRMILLTTHRRENHSGGHARIFQAALQLCTRFPKLHIVLPLHPNPAVQKAAHEILPKSLKSCIHVVSPIGYLMTSLLQKKSVMIMTDSGGIQEEAAALQRPVLVLRENTERMEGVKAGISEIVGTDIDLIVTQASKILKNVNGIHDTMSRAKFPYGNGTAAKQIVAVLINRYEGRRSQKVAGKRFT